MDEAKVEVILKWVEENGPLVAEINAKLAGITAQTTAANAAAGAGWQTWAAWAAGIGIAVAALSPFIALVGAATVIVTTFAIAGAGALALFGGLAAGFAAIGAGILFLGGGGGVGAAAALASTTDKLTSATEALQEFDAAHKGVLTILQQQQREQLVENIAKAQGNYADALTRSQGPTGVLLAQLSAVRDAWAQQAAPMAAVITQWAATAIPGIQALGSSMMDWFGARLPGVLSALSKIVQDLTPTFIQFGQFVGSTMDKVFGMTSIGPGGTIVTLGQLFTQAIQGMMGGVQVFIGLLAQLTSWFLERLPSYGKITSDVFGFLGNVVLGIASVWGKFADWLVSQWPTITANASAAVQSIAKAWSDWQPSMQAFTTAILPAVGPLLKQIADNAGSLVPLIMAATQLFIALSVAVLGAVAVVSTLVTQFDRLANAIKNLPGGFLLPGSGSNPLNSIGSVGAAAPAGSPTRYSGLGIGGGGNTIIQHNTFTGVVDPQAAARATAAVLRNAQRV